MVEIMETNYARKLTAKEEIPRPKIHPSDPTPPPCLADKGDVAFYEDEAMTKFVGVWRACYKPPTRRNKYVTLNCTRRRLVWQS